MENNRREFIKKTSIISGAMMLPGLANAAFQQSKKTDNNPIRVSQLKKPVAIAMWDFSWILRHHRYGEFEDWDQILSELAERGYNAIRMDAMPQYVAANSNGIVETEFRSVKEDWKPAMWGNDYTMSFRPREALLEFLPKCKKYGIKVGLATWFMRHGTNREDIFLEKGGLLRAWDETLAFLKSNNLLDNILYVDLLNEYPNVHGYDWLKNELNKRSNFEKFKLGNPEANIPEIAAENEDGNLLRLLYHREFMNSMIGNLRGKYPELDFFTSYDSGMKLEDIDCSQLNALDYHIWFNHANRIPGLGDIGSRNQSLNTKDIYTNLLRYWDENKKSLVDWMEGRISDIAQKALSNNIVCGNTEGWGPILWYDHPELDWKWVKEAADICVPMALQHDSYKFICSSNFTHPQFKGIWEDVKWHRQITSRIKE